MFLQQIAVLPWWLSCIETPASSRPLLLQSRQIFQKEIANGQYTLETLMAIRARVEVTHFLPRQALGPVEQLEEQCLEGSLVNTHRRWRAEMHLLANFLGSVLVWRNEDLSNNELRKEWESAVRAFPTVDSHDCNEGQEYQLWFGLPSELGS